MRARGLGGWPSRGRGACRPGTPPRGGPAPEGGGRTAGAYVQESDRGSDRGGRGREAVGARTRVGGGEEVGRVGRGGGASARGGAAGAGPAAGTPSGHPGARGRSSFGLLVAGDGLTPACPTAAGRPARSSRTVVGWPHARASSAMADTGERHSLARRPPAPRPLPRVPLERNPARTKPRAPGRPFHEVRRHCRSSPGRARGNRPPPARRRPGGRSAFLSPPGG